MERGTSLLHSHVMAPAEDLAVFGDKAGSCMDRDLVSRSARQKRQYLSEPLLPQRLASLPLLPPGTRDLILTLCWRVVRYAEL